MLTSDEALSCIEEFPACVHFQPLPDIEKIRIGNDPASLAIIVQFIWKAKTILRTKRAIAISVRNCGKDVANAALLVGCYLILCRQFTVDEVIEGISPISSELLAFDEVTLAACLTSFYHATKIHWLRSIESSFPDDEKNPSSEINPPAFDFHEYLHYHEPANGNFHLIIPRRLLVFHEPQCTFPGRAWEDIDGRRHFSAEYYADLFHELNVRLILRVVRANDKTELYSPTIFTKYGIAVEDLMLDGTRPSVLQSLDRFLAILRQTPGAVAVHGGTEGLGDAEALIAACLSCCCGFTPPAAVAWLQMAHQTTGAGRRRAPPLPSGRAPRPAMAEADSRLAIERAGWEDEAPSRALGPRGGDAALPERPKQACFRCP